jgi:hypothetical protein
MQDSAKEAAKKSCATHSRSRWLVGKPGLVRLSCCIYKLNSCAEKWALSAAEGRPGYLPKPPQSQRRAARRRAASSGGRRQQFVAEATAHARRAADSDDKKANRSNPSNRDNDIFIAARFCIEGADRFRRAPIRLVA